MTPQIKSIMFHLTVELSVETLAKFLCMSVDGVRELWDRDELRNHIATREVIDLSDVEKSLDEHGGFTVGKGLL